VLACGTRAAALNALGRHAEARAVCERALGQSGAGEKSELLMATLLLHIERGVADARLGEATKSVEQLERLLNDDRLRDNPLAQGLLHEALARVAIVVVDRAAFERHRRAADGIFRATQNPALVARQRRLRALAVAAGLIAPSTATPETDGLDTATRELLDACSTTGERAQIALQFLCERAGAIGGHIVVPRDSLPEVRAATPLSSLPLEVELALLSKLEELVENEERMDDATDVSTEDTGSVTGTSAPSTDHRNDPYRILPLLTHAGGKVRVAGVAALRRGEEPLRPLAYPVIDAVARVLRDVQDPLSAP
jgi:hypothetical protein